MRNVELKLIAIQHEWMILQQYEEKILVPSLTFDSLHEPEKIQEVDEFLLTKEKIEVEREIYIMLLNAKIEIESAEKNLPDYFYRW